MKKFYIVLLLAYCMQQASAQSWNITGNAGTDSSKNFIGTKDAHPLVFRVNNQKAGWLDYNTAKANTGYGYQSLFKNKNGVQNTAAGFAAMYSNTSGNYNAAYGYQALYSNASGYANAAMGLAALYTNTVGHDNTANGNVALYFNISGSNNTANGSHALLSNTSGYLNTATGVQSLYYNKIGHDNAANGYESLYANTNGSNNTALGNYTLSTNTSGTNNTAVGYNAGVSAGNFNNATAIGANAVVSNSNSLVLGNNANVGIGTSAPSYKLSVQSATVESNNNTDLLSLTGRNPVIAFNDESNAGYGYIKSITNTPNPGYSKGMEFGASPGYSIYFSTNYEPVMMITDAGNVGIGTSSPAYKLSVNGTIQSKEVRVETGWSDYVFDKGYKLLSLDSVAEYIEKNKHLPGIPSAKEIQDNGLAVGEVQTKMMAKIEELTLYIIEQEKSINDLKKQNEKLETKINSLAKGGK